MMRIRSALVIATAAMLLAGCVAPAPAVDEREALLDTLSEIDGILIGGEAFDLHLDFYTARAELSVPIAADSSDEFIDITEEVVDAWTQSPLADQHPLFLTLSTSGGYSQFEWVNVDTDDLEPYLAATRIWWDLDAVESPTLTTGTGTNFIRNGEFGIEVIVESDDLGPATVAEIEQAVTDAGLTFRPGGISASD